MKAGTVLDSVCVKSLAVLLKPRKPTVPSVLVMFMS